MEINGIVGDTTNFYMGFVESPTIPLTLIAKLYLHILVGHFQNLVELVRSLFFKHSNAQWNFRAFFIQPLHRPHHMTACF